MLQNASDCIRMLHNASEGSRMHQNASEHFRMLQIASECFRLHKKAWESRILETDGNSACHWHKRACANSTYSEAFWSILMHSEAFWCILKHSDAIWSILKYSEAFWCILKPSDALWSLLMHSEAFWSILKQSEAIWSIAVLPTPRTVRGSPRLGLGGSPRVCCMARLCPRRLGRSQGNSRRLDRFLFFFSCVTFFRYILGVFV